MEAFINSLTVADYVVLGIFLLFIIIGACRGFMKSIGGIFVTVCSILVASMFSYIVTDFLKANTGIFQWLTEKLTFGTTADVATGSADVTGISTETMTEVLSKAGFPEIFRNNVLENVAALKYPEVSTLGSYVNYSLADIIMTVIGFVAVLIVAAIVFALVKILLEKIAKSSVMKYVDMLLGMGFGAVIALIVVYVICMILPTVSLIVNNTAFTEFVNSISTSPIASIFYNDNLIAQWIGSVIKL